MLPDDAAADVDALSLLVGGVGNKRLTAQSPRPRATPLEVWKVWKVQGWVLRPFLAAAGAASFASSCW